MTERLIAFTNRAFGRKFTLSVPDGEADITLEAVIFRIGYLRGNETIIEVSDSDVELIVPDLVVTSSGISVTLKLSATQIALLGNTGTFAYDIEAVTSTGSRRLDVDGSGSGTIELKDRLS